MQIGSVVWEEFDHIHTYIHTESGQCSSQFTCNAQYQTCFAGFDKPTIFSKPLNAVVPLHMRLRYEVKISLRPWPGIIPIAHRMALNWTNLITSYLITAIPLQRLSDAQSQWL